MDKINVLSFPERGNTEVIYKDFNGITIEVFKKTTTTRLMNAIQWGIDHIVTDTPIVSTPLAEIIYGFCTLHAFTNIDVLSIDTTKSPEDVYAVYDNIEELIKDVEALIDAEQKSFLSNGLLGLTANLVNYRNSAAGILESLTSMSDQSTTSFKENIALIQDAGNLDNIRGLLQTINALETPLSK